MSCSGLSGISGMAVIFGRGFLAPIEVLLGGMANGSDFELYTDGLIDLGTLTHLFGQTFDIYSNGAVNLGTIMTSTAYLGFESEAEGTIMVLQDYVINGPHVTNAAAGYLYKNHYSQQSFESLADGTTTSLPADALVAASAGYFQIYT